MWRELGVTRLMLSPTWYSKVKNLVLNLTGYVMVLLDNQILLESLLAEVNNLNLLLDKLLVLLLYLLDGLKQRLSSLQNLILLLGAQLVLDSLICDR